MARIRLRLHLFSLVLFGTLVPVVFCICITPQHRINEETFARIEVGMTITEVEGILGVPPGDYGSGKILIECCSQINWLEDNGDWYDWRGNDLVMRISFSKDGKVQRKRLRSLLREETLVESATSWLCQLVR